MQGERLQGERLCKRGIMVKKNLSTNRFPPHSHSGSPSLFALAPFLIFISMYIFLILIFPDASNNLKLAAFPVFAGITAIGFSLFTFQERIPISKKIKIFISGVARPTVMYMCFIFIFSSIFSYVISACGGVDAAIKLCYVLIPKQWILPGIFTTIAIFSLTIGSSIGGIATFTPIAVGLAPKLGVSTSLMAGIAVGAAMLGDNLSVISDTTVASIHTTNCDPYKKFKGNAIMVIPAFILTIILLTIINFHIQHPLHGLVTTWGISDVIKTIPYGAVFTLALLGIDVLVVLALGAITAATLGIIYHKFSVLQAITFFFDGFYLQKGVVAMLVLVMLIAGLSRIVEHNGGIRYLLCKFHAKTKTKAGAEGSIALLVSLLDIAVARNTIAILIAGPMAQQIGGRFKIKSARIATLLDIFSCAIHGIIPYSSQLLLAAAMAGTSSISIVPHVYYQYMILLIAIISVARTKFKEKKNEHSN
jgi:Na+/H+ antiporter NhaC